MKQRQTLNIHYPEPAFSSKLSTIAVGSFFSILCKLKSNQQILLLRKKNARPVASVFAGFTYYNRNVLQGTIQYLQGNGLDDLIQLFHFWLLRTAQADPSSQRDFYPTALNEEKSKARIFLFNIKRTRVANHMPSYTTTQKTLWLLNTHKTQNICTKGRKLILYLNFSSNLERFIHFKT